MLKVEIIAGTTIADAAYEAIALAEKVRCFVTFDFNGIEMMVHRDSAPSEIENEYHKRLSKKAKSK